MESEAGDGRQASMDVPFFFFLYFFGLSWLFDRIAEEVIGNRMRERGSDCSKDKASGMGPPALPTKLNGTPNGCAFVQNNSRNG